MNNELIPSHVSHSLIRKLGWLGGERTLVLIALLISVYFAFIYALTVGVIPAIVISFTIWIAFMFVLVRMGKHDMQMYEVYKRHRKYRTFYPAKGRLDAPIVEYKGFTGKH